MIRISDNHTDPVTPVAFTIHAVLVMTYTYYSGRLYCTKYLTPTWISHQLSGIQIDACRCNFIHFLFDFFEPDNELKYAAFIK